MLCKAGSALKRSKTKVPNSHLMRSSSFFCWARRRASRVAICASSCAFLVSSSSSRASVGRQGSCGMRVRAGSMITPAKAEWCIQRLWHQRMRLTGCLIAVLCGTPSRRLRSARTRSLRARSRSRCRGSWIGRSVWSCSAGLCSGSLSIVG